MTNTCSTVLIASHRGGSMKSTLAWLLAEFNARRGQRVRILDTSRSGGCASFEHPELYEDILTDSTGASHALRRHRTMPLDVLRIPEYAGDLEVYTEDCDLLLVDSPPVRRELLVEPLRQVKLLLITIPVDVLALRSLVPWLRFLQQQRALGNRQFTVGGVLAGVERSGNRALDEEAMRWLDPVLLPGGVPCNDVLRDSVSNGNAPELATIGREAERPFALLAREVASRLSAPFLETAGR